MGTIQAIFENGVFRPTSPVALPEATEVEFEPRLVVAANLGEIETSSTHSLPRSDPASATLVLSRSNRTLDELDALLDELSISSTGMSLPVDFSRADNYDDHD